MRDRADSASTSQKTWRQNAWPVASSVLILAALCVLVAQFIQWNGVSPEEDWQSAAEHVRKHWKEGDAFRVEPYWDARPRVHFEPHQDFVPSKNATWFDLSPYARIWGLVEEGREKDFLHHMPPGWTLQPPSGSFGAVKVFQALPPQNDRTQWDVLSNLKEARVEHVHKKKTQRCKDYRDKPLPRWRCRDRSSFHDVGETRKMLTNEVHRCLWAMPIPGQGFLRVSFENLPKKGTLMGHYGQTFKAIRSSRGEPVTFRVRAGEEVIHRKEFGLHEEGFQPFSVPLDFGPDEEKRLSFEVESKSQVDRFFCFAARVVQRD